MTTLLPSLTDTDSTTEPIPALLQQLGQWILSSDIALAVFSPEDEIYFASEAFRKLYYLQPGQQTFESMMRYCYQEKVGPRIDTTDIDAWLAAADERRRKLPRRVFQTDFIDGRWMLMSEIMQNDGWMLLSATDITFIKTEELTLRNARDSAIIASETDHLTGLLNRRAIMARLDQLIDQQINQYQPFLIALIDIDYFKSINDTLGHAVGDEVLQHFSDTLRTCIRDTDWIGRIGGEEFLLVMRETSEDDARKTLLRVRDHLQQHSYQTPEAATHYTFSAGIAMWGPDQTLSDLYKAADLALYAAKLDGRNLIRLAAKNEKDSRLV